MAGIDLLDVISGDEDFKKETMFSDFNVKQYRDNPDTFNKDFLGFFYDTFNKMKRGENRILSMDGYCDWFRFNFVGEKNLSNDVYRVYLTIKNAYLEEITQKLIDSDLPLSSIKVVQKNYDDDLIQSREEPETTYNVDGSKTYKEVYYPSMVIFLDKDESIISSVIELLSEYDRPDYIAKGYLGKERQKVSDLFYIADHSTTVMDSKGCELKMKEVYEEVKGAYLRLKEDTKEE